MELLSDDLLEQSAVVANCRMNRERNLAGSNGYDRELGFAPLAFLDGQPQDAVAWLDLCCGTGKALIEAARVIHGRSEAPRIAIVGVDLVGMFAPIDPASRCLRLVQASLGRWQPDRSFDLITCVHGLHYIGDRLGLIRRAASWLTPDGLFVANLDLANLKILARRDAGRQIASGMRRNGLTYDRRKRLLVCRGKRLISLHYRYLSGDDRAGPNYTGQPAVDSYYEPEGPSALS